MEKHIAYHKGVFTCCKERIDTRLAVFIVTFVEEQGQHPRESVHHKDAKLGGAPQLIVIQMLHHADERGYDEDQKTYCVEY